MITGGTAILSSGHQVIVPEWEFNAFYLMQHCYHHMFESGLGLRQLMDYYFLLHSTPESGDHSKIESLFREFGIMRFASAVMWILQNIFKLESKYLICYPDEHEGRFILNEVMAGGNFGHHDTRIKRLVKENSVPVYQYSAQLAPRHSLSIRVLLGANLAGVSLVLEKTLKALKLTEPHIFKGYWWVPGNPEKKVAGIVT